MVKGEEGCQERSPYNRQSLPWGFLFYRSPKKCVLSDRLSCLENSGTLTETASARMEWSQDISGKIPEIPLAGPNPIPADFDLEDFLTRTLDKMGALQVV